MRAYLRRILTLSLLIAISLKAGILAGEPNPGGNVEDEWSEITNGLKARLQVERWKIRNGSCVMATYLELENHSATLQLTETQANMKFRVTDKDGRDVNVERNVSFNGWMGENTQLALPHAATIRVRLGPTGHGIKGNLAAHLDLGIDYYWALPQGEFYLSGVIEIERKTKSAGDSGNPWHGRIELPPILIPTKPTKVAPEKLEALIDELGAKIVSKNGFEAEDAANRLSLIDDPRVVPWYVRSLKTRGYHFKCLALDRLYHYDTNEALDALKYGMATQPEDLASSTKREVAESLANNIRVYAANGLAKSSNPDAGAFLLTFHDDPSPSIRLKVIQYAAMLGTKEALSLIRSHLDDEDQMIQKEVKVLLQNFEQKE